MPFNRLSLQMKAAVRTVLGGAAHRGPTIRPWLEVLEDRTVPSTINWLNRGSATVDSDGFNSVFGAIDPAVPNLARAVVDAAIASWERTIILFNQPFGGNTLNVTIGMSPLGAGLGGITVADANPLTGLPTGGVITLFRGTDTIPDPLGLGDGGGWFVDPTPNESSEFNGTIVNAFVGLAPLSSPVSALSDLLSTVTHELGHVVGFFPNPLLRYHQLTTNTSIPDTTASAGGNGTFWVFSGPSISHLMTSNNGGPTGQGMPFSLHSAAPGSDPALPVTFGGRTFFGATDLMNSTSPPGERELLSNSLALVLQDGYGYTIQQPELFGTFHALLNTTTGNLLVRGAAGTSADTIKINRSASGANLIVSVDLGADVPGTGPTDAFVSSFPIGAVRSITVEAGSGDDTLELDFAGGNLLGITPITYDGGVGIDRVVATANANFTLTDTSLFVAGNAFVTLSSVEDAGLTGGAGSNTFTVTGWSRAGSLDGVGGADIVVAADEASYTLTDTSLTRTGRTTLALNRIEAATLTGGDLFNTFTVTGWSGSASLDGAGGTDRVVSANNAGFTLTATALSRSTGGTFTLQNIEDASLTGGFGDDQFLLNNWPGSASLLGNSGADTLTVIGSANIDIFVVSALAVARAGRTISYSGFELLTVDAAAGADSIRVLTTAAGTPVTVIGGPDNDTIYLDAARFITGLFPNFQVGRAINSALTIDGASGAVDTLNVAFSGAGIPAFEIDTVELPANRLNAAEGLTAAGITYGNLDFLNLSLGDGNDTLNVISTLAGVSTTIGMGVGTDLLTLGGSSVNSIQGPVTIDGGANVTGSPDAVILQESEQPGHTNVGFLGAPPNAGPGVGFLSGFGMGATVNFSNVESVTILENLSNDFVFFQFGSAPQFAFGMNLGLGNDGVTFEGTEGNDHIHISRRVGANGAEVVAQINGRTIVAGYLGGETVSVRAGRGDDKVTIDDSVTTWRAELFGGDGNDRLFGGPLADLLDGDAGHDRLEGGAGDDELIGGAGHDIFVGGAGADRIVAADGLIDLVFADGDDLLGGLDRFDRRFPRRRRLRALFRKRPVPKGELAMSFDQPYLIMKATFRAVLGDATRRRGKTPPKPGFRPRLEILEHRLAPATVSWTGLGPNEFWTTAENWQDSIRPSPGDVLVFPSMHNGALRPLPSRDVPAGFVTQKTTINNFADDVRFSGLTFLTSGYSISGSRIALGAAGITVAGRVLANVINAPLLLPNPAGIAHPIEVTSPYATLQLAGTISGPGGLTKSGNGTLEVFGANTYEGTTTIADGKLYVEHSFALGSPANGTVVNRFNSQYDSDLTNHPQLVIGTSITVEAEPLVILGERNPDEPGLLSAEGLNAVWNGPITLHPSPTSFSLRLPIGTDLTLAGPIIGGVPFQVVQDGLGTITLAGTSPNDFALSIRQGRVSLKKPSGATPFQSVSIGSGAELRLLASNQISDAASIVLGPDALLNLNSFDDSIGSLQMAGGRVWTGKGTLSTSLDPAVTSSGPTQAIIDGKLSPGSKRTFEVTGGAGLIVNAVIGGTSPTAGLVKTGASTLRLTANNTYAGQTSIDAGRLEVDGSQPGTAVLVRAGGSLGGAGRVGSIHVNANGTLDPGPGAVLGVNGDVTFVNTSTLIARPIATNPSGFNATGKVNLGGGKLVVGLVPLDIALPPLGAALPIVINPSGSISGTFIGLPNGAIVGATYATGAILFRINYAPTVVLLTRISGPAFQNRTVTTPINEGGIVTVAGTITTADPRDRFFLDVNWGDGSPVQTFTVNPKAPRTLSVSHRYLDDNPSGTPTDTYTIGLLWRDQRGAQNTGTLVVTVNNVAPLVFAGGDASVHRGGTFARMGSFVDAGVLDTWTATVDYGDGSGVQALRLDRTQRFHLHHRFAQAGRFQVVVRVQDDDGGVRSAKFFVTVTGLRHDDAWIVPSILDAYFGNKRSHKPVVGNHRRED